MDIKENLMGKVEEKSRGVNIEPRFQIRVSIGGKKEKPSGAEVLAYVNGEPLSVLMEKEHLGVEEISDIYTRVVTSSIPHIRRALEIEPELKFSFKLYRLHIENIYQIEDILNLFREADIPFRNLEFETDLDFLRKCAQGEEVLRKLTLLSIVTDFVLEFGDEVCIPHRFINRLLIQKIKIPSDVVEEILDQTTSLVFGKNVKLLKGLVKFLKELEISVLVDGVKTKAAVDFLSLMGVDEAQGPYFGPPLDGEKFLECLKSFHKTGRCASN